MTGWELPYSSLSAHRTYLDGPQKRYLCFETNAGGLRGASSGLGEAIARALAARGASVIVSGRNTAGLDAVVRAHKNALSLPFEATDFPAIPRIVEQAWAWKGRIDGLVNNAGISQRSLATETAFAVYEKIIAVDLLAPIALTQALLPRMVRAGQGRIVAISSIAGLFGAPLRSAYSAAKHGVIGYHDSVRAENEHLGIRVHVVAPGSIRTNVARNALTGDGSRREKSDQAIDNGMPPSEAAQAILSMIESGRRELVLATGAERDIAFLRRSNPEALFDRMSAERH